MSNRAVVIGVALFLCLVLAAPGHGQETKAPASSWERYKVITQNNIFLRNRVQPTRQTSASSTTVRRPQINLVLTGIMGKDEEYLAFLEDSRTGATSVVRINDPLADGRIAKIEVDRILLERGDRAIEVRIGGSLDVSSTTETSAPVPVPEQTAATQPPPSTGGGTPTTDQNAVRDRLRQRRQRELSR